MLPDEPIYYVDHRKKSVWVQNFKAGSRSINNSIGYYISGGLCRRPKSIIHEYLNYTWVMVTREPIKRLHSYWSSEVPEKEHKTYPLLVDAILSGWENPHITPQYLLIEGLKYPEVCIDLSQLNNKWDEISTLFSWPVPLEVKNPSIKQAINSNYRQEELINYYIKDYKIFNYEIPA